MVPTGQLPPRLPQNEWPLEFCTLSLLMGWAQDNGRTFVGRIPQADRRKPHPSVLGQRDPWVLTGALSAGARRGHPQGGSDISLGPVISQRVHSTLLRLTCNHKPSPSPPEASSSQTQAALGLSQANMDAGKEGLPLRIHCLVQPPNICRWLSPFFLTCSIYFLLWIPEDQPSWVSALVKCLPILCLAAFLWAVPSGGDYTRLLQAALVCSAVGDACLIWPGAFLAGMAAFALAHVLYSWAFGFSPLRPGLLLLILLAPVLSYRLLWPYLEPGMVLPMAAYELVLSVMLWRGLARGGSAGWGALLFAVSDAVLAWDTFAQPLPYARLVTMSTYYAAQLLITWSALGSPGPKTD
nr:lysoplasmalogenase [Microcebus murinus]